MLILDVDKLLAILEERHMTKADLSRALGWHRNTISTMIGKSSRGGGVLLSTAQAIARVLQVNVRSITKPDHYTRRR